MRRIEADGYLRPLNVSYRGLIWLSDLAVATPEELGLTMFMLRCNRMEWVCEVDTDLAMPWTFWAHVNKVESRVRDMLDGAPGANPRHWYVTEAPLKVISIERGI